MSLVLRRKIDQAVVIGGNIRIRVGKVSGGTVPLIIDAPASVTVLREELTSRVQESELESVSLSNARRMVDYAFPTGFWANSPRWPGDAEGVFGCDAYEVDQFEKLVAVAERLCIPAGVVELAILRACSVPSLARLSQLQCECVLQHLLNLDSATEQGVLNGVV